MRDRTHYEGCWRVHHECAVAEVERLQARAEAVREGLHALRDRTERLEAIVRGFAEEDPRPTIGSWCAWCDASPRESHAPDCLWLRARQEVGDDG